MYHQETTITVHKMRVVEQWNSIPDILQTQIFNYDATLNTSSRRELSHNVVSEDESDSDLNIEV